MEAATRRVEFADDVRVPPSAQPIASCAALGCTHLQDLQVVLEATSPQLEEVEQGAGRFVEIASSSLLAPP